MMIPAYDKCYLEDTMSNLGAMLDFAVGSCGEDLSLFWSRFIASGLSGQIEKCNPRYLCGLSGTEMAVEVCRKTGAPLPAGDGIVDIGSPEYWTGWTIAYIQWYLNLGFDVIEYGGLPITELYNVYSPLHEADLSRSVQFAEAYLQRGTERRFKNMRKNAGFSQEQLSVRTGIPIRTIRAYEQGALSLDRASAANTRLIESALGCKL